MEEIETLEYLQDYQKHLVEKYQVDYPSYLKNVKTPKMIDKELKRISDKIRQQSYCERHGGSLGLDCFLCKLEGKF